MTFTPAKDVPQPVHQRPVYHPLSVLRPWRRWVVGWVALGMGVLAQAGQADILVVEAMFPIEVDTTTFKPKGPVDLEQRTAFVTLAQDPVEVTVPDHTGRLYMLARDAVFRVVQEVPLAQPPVVQLVIAGSKPCRLHVVSQVLLLSAYQKKWALPALMADGCKVSSNRYSAVAVVGATGPVMWIGKAPKLAPPVLELLTVPQGMSPNSSTAAIVIPEENRRRKAAYEEELRTMPAHVQAAADKAAEKGGMLDNDERLKPFVAHLAQDAQRKGFVPDVFIAAEPPLVHFSHTDGRAFTMSWDTQGRAQFKEHRR